MPVEGAGWISPGRSGGRYNTCAALTVKNYFEWRPVVYLIFVLSLLQTRRMRSNPMIFHACSI